MTVNYACGRPAARQLWNLPTFSSSTRGAERSASKRSRIWSFRGSAGSPSSTTPPSRKPTWASTSFSMRTVSESREHAAAPSCLLS